MRRVVVAAVLAAGCGSSGGGMPTSPGSTQPPPTGGPPPSPGPHLVTGSIVNALDEAAGAPNVAFTAGGTLVGRSDAGGHFSVGLPASGVNRAVLSAAGYVTRETGINAPGGDLRLSLIPSTFNLAAFDQMFRPSGGGLARWTSAPAIVLERRVVRFAGSTCVQSYQALDETISDADSDEILSDLRDGYEMLTAGGIGPLTSVTTQLSAAGSAVDPRRDRTIIVMRGEGLFAATDYWGSACWSRSADGSVTSGFIVLDNAFERAASRFHRSIRMHELGHTLGCTHVTGQTSVMNPSARTEPNEFDRQAARIAALRPIGNRSPDLDPFMHVAAMIGASQPVTWYRAH
jgi:hypothetical protein